METNILKFAQKLESILGVHPDSFLGANQTRIITKEEYLDELFAPRRALDHIKKILNRKDNPRIRCLAGPRGSGKTTIALKFQQEYASLPTNKFYLFQVLPDEDEKIMVEKLHRSVKGFLQGHFSPNFDLGIENPQIKFLDFFFDTSLAKDLRPEEMFDFDFADEYRSAMELKHEFDIKNGKKISVREWINEVYNSTDNRAKSIFREIFKRADIEHYCYALQYSGVQNIVIWIDNVDVLPDGQQKDLMHVIEQLKDKSDHIIKFFVSVREENVHVIDHNSELPTFYTRDLITVSFTEDQEERQIYEANLIPYLLPKEVLQIIQNRLTLALKKTQEEGEVKFIEQIFPQFQILSDFILKTFQENRIFYITNHSLRSLLPYFGRFFMQLVKFGFSNEQNRLKILDYVNDRTVMRTKLIEWLHVDQRFCGLDCFSMVSYIRTHNFESGEALCYIEYLVLTSMINHMNQQDPDRRPHTFSERHLPTIAQICLKLSEVGFKEDKVKAAIWNLSAGYEGKGGNFINIRSRRRLENISQIDNNFRIRLTYRVPPALAMVYNSFTYNYLSFFPNKTINLEVDEMAKQGFELLKPMCDFGIKHLKSLQFLRRGPLGANFGSNWLGFYRHTFGMPGKFQKDRIMGKTNRFKSDSKLLFFESISLSIAYYFQFHKLNHLSQHYSFLYEWYHECAKHLSEPSNGLIDEDFFQLDYNPDSKKFIVSELLKESDFPTNLHYLIED